MATGLSCLDSLAKAITHCAFRKIRGGASSRRGDKWLKPTTKRQREGRPRSPRRLSGLCGRGIHARCVSAQCAEKHRPQEASSPRGDKWLKPTTTRQCEIRPRNPRRLSGLCGRGIHARCVSARFADKHRPQEASWLKPLPSRAIAGCQTTAPLRRRGAAARGFG
jgi:hypothetical protein